MSGFWRGYANVNDDVRHTYEHVFFGRQTTGNLTESDIPGMKPEPSTPEAVAGAAQPQQHDHAGFYGSVWGNGDAPAVGPGATPIGPEPTPGGAAAPSKADDMTPGY